MALAVNDIRDRVANRLYSRAYSTLDALDRGRIDNEGDDALLVIERYAQYWPIADNAPEEWIGWFTDETAYRVALSTHPERADTYRRACDRSRTEAIGSFARKTSTYSPASDTEAFAYTVQNLRNLTLAYTTRLKPPLLPEPSAIDAAIGWALRFVWEAGHWTFRRRHTTITLATNGTVTVNGLGSDTFDSIASYFLYHDDATGDKVIWATADEMSDLKSGESSNTGRPEWFRIQHAGDTASWLFHPLPDQAYTFRAEVLIRGPGNPSSASETTTMAKFASEFMPTVRDLVLGKVLDDHQITRESLDRAMLRAQELFQPSQQPAKGESSHQQRDAYGDAYDLMLDQRWTR